MRCSLCCQRNSIGFANSMHLCVLCVDRLAFHPWILTFYSRRFHSLGGGVKQCVAVVSDANAVTAESLGVLRHWGQFNVRHHFNNDSRTMGGLEAISGKDWMRTRRRDPIYFYAEKSWDQLRTERLRGNRRLGLRDLRGLVELASAAANL